LRGVLIFTLCCIMATAAGCGGGSGSPSSQASTPASAGQNVQPITVNGGPIGEYADGVFTSVTICTPGTSTCNTIDGVLVDTGSVGLRLLSSLVTASLPPTTINGNPLSNCAPFVDGSYLWGSVATADVKLSGETAASVPIQLISDATTGIPAACSDGGVNEGTVQTLGANGILGVGPYLQDCGAACAASPSLGLYFSCPASGCVGTTVPVGQQLQNPVSLFASDNNGVIVELPSISTAAATASGSLVFGIGTQSNNGLGGAKVYTINNGGYFATSFNSQSFPESFIDSGSNGYFFADNSIAECSDNGFYCPGSPLSLSATNSGANSSSGSVGFGVGNADLLFSNLADNAFSTLAGPNTSGSFDWGLPFFFGRNVFTAIETRTSPGGTGPYWAY
jgi:Protein of unknown function (DUF3443)